ncbi:MAG TPA: endonuclease III [Anaerolineales bacterium]|nr:endonuclease III [Anaerolineales bacterium]
MENLAEKALKVHQTMLDFYGYPEWRNPLPPLDELISTILSQNTNDTNRDVAFFALKDKFPTWEEVRDADVEEVMDAIRSAGLANQKGPRIQNVLQQITEMRGELDISFLSEMTAKEATDWLVQFKGVGPKTAAIVLQFSLDIPAFPVDTHVHRITGRLGVRPEKMSADKTHEHMEELLPPETFYPAHLNFIRLGREICKARSPQCPECPLTELCQYYKTTYQEQNS